MRLVFASIFVFAVVVAAACEDEPLVALPGRVLGVICDPQTGFPASEVPIRIDIDGAVTAGATDREGNVAIGGLDEGTGTLTATFPGGERSFSVDARRGSTLLFEDPACRAIPPLPGNGDVVGVVCNRHTGEVVQNATVTLLLSDGSTVETTTNADGSFGLFEVPAGSYVVIVASATYRRSYAVDVDDGGVTEIPGDNCLVPSLSLGLLSGHLCDPGSDGDPLRGADVVVTAADGAVHEELTDDAGAFLVGPMAPGRALIHVTRAPDVAIDLVAVVVAGGEAEVTNGGACVVEQCSDTTVAVEPPDLPELLLVVDRSGSMNEAAPGYGTTRWLGVKDALIRVTRTIEERVAFGLMLFPALGTVDGCSAAVVDVEPAFAAAAAIGERLDDFDTEPLGATPTAASLLAARNYLRATPSTRPRAVLLATDGGPNCNAALDPFSCRCSAGGDTACADAAFSDPDLAAQLCLDDDNAVGAVQDLRDDGVDTYVVGVPGVENFSDVLNAMAEAGGTRLPGATGFYLARDSATLEGAIADIGRRLSSCDIDVEGVDLVRAARLAVAIDDVDVPRDPDGVDGFDIVDADTLTLFGPACDALGGGGALTLTTCDLLADAVGGGP